MLLRDYAGRPTPLYLAERLSEAAGREVWLKREDLMHTGSHKLNNALGQALLAKRMGKPRIIAETGAGQHGVAQRDRVRAARPRVHRLHGRRGHPPPAAQRPAHGAARRARGPRRGRARGRSRRRSREAIRDWVTNVATTHYIIGSAVGPAPYPAIVRDLQRVIGDEARAQLLERAGRLPDRVIACVGGGSNSIGMFAGFVDDAGRRARRRRGGGRGARDRPPRRAADRRRAPRRAARLAVGGPAGRRGPDHRGALGLGRPRLPGLGPRARLAARHGPRDATSR